MRFQRSCKKLLPRLMRMPVIRQPIHCGAACTMSRSSNTDTRAESATAMPTASEQSALHESFLFCSSQMSFRVSTTASVRSPKTSTFQKSSIPFTPLNAEAYLPALSICIAARATLLPHRCRKKGLLGKPCKKLVVPGD